MKALILIGGFGTRLRPLTCETPKPLLPLVNRSFLEYQFELLKKHGIREVTLCAAYLPGEFKKKFGTGARLGMKIRYILEKMPLGTGGAIRNARQTIDETTCILNGDILTDLDLTAMYKHHRKNAAVVTIGLARVKDPTIYGLVETDRSGRIERFIEKPSWDEVTCNTINAGVYLFEPHVVDRIPEGINYSVERGLFPALLLDKSPLYGFVHKKYWMDIGTVEKYLQAHGDIMDGSTGFRVQARSIGRGIWAAATPKLGKAVLVQGKLVCGRNVRIGESVRINGNVCLGNNVSIGRGSTVTDSVILDDTSVAEGTRFERALVGRDCVIEANASLGRGVVIGDGTRISRYSRLVGGN